VATTAHRADRGGGIDRAPERIAEERSGVNCETRTRAGCYHRGSDRDMISAIRDHIGTLLRRIVLATLLVVSLGAQAHAQIVVVAADTAEVAGLATGLQGSTILPGVLVRCLDATGRAVGSVLSGGDGRFRLPGLPAGTFRLTAALEGFREFSETIILRAGERIERKIDLQLAGVSETMDVVARAGDMKTRMGATLSPTEHIGTATLEQLPLHDGNLGALLAFMPGVVHGREGASIRGGFPAQSTVQMGSASATEPSLGGQDLEFPSDAVAGVDILPNPYAVEFGRFSSGVSVVDTRPGGQAWRTTFQDFDPTLRRRRGELGLAGIEAIAPRLFFGGPLVADRLFLAQSIGGRYYSPDVMSLPQSQRSTYLSLSSFTRVDAAFGGGRSVVVTAGIFPQRVDAFNLDTFNPPDVAADRQQRVYTAGATVKIPTPGGALVESTVQFGRYRVNIDGEPADAMVVTPDVNHGGYYNTQERRTDVLQWVASVSGDRKGAWGEHFLKAGLDVLAASYDGSSVSRPVRVLREDLTLAQTITFGTSRAQRVGAVDAAVFVQDRWHPASRVLLEAGGRLDRDGVLGTLNLTPRLGAVLALEQNGNTTLQGGVGLFFERTPPMAAAFDLTESRTITRFAADGLTPLGPAVVFTPQLSANMGTARSRTWNVGFERRITPALTLRAGVLEREGSDALIVTPEDPLDGQSSASLLLGTRGKSSYREGSVSVLYTPRADREVSASYLRSSARANLNVYSVLDGLLTDPFVRRDEYGPTDSDAPNRLVAHALMGFWGRFRVFAGVELRSGLPWSVVNEQQDYVGPRNSGHYFPAVRRVDLAFESRFSILKWHPWVGVRLYNAFNVFLPNDVQANLGSPAFGGFSNQATRLIRFTIRVEK
jgi:hypothetical protein